MFAYCNNNSIMFIDSAGNRPVWFEGNLGGVTVYADTGTRMSTDSTKKSDENYTLDTALQVLEAVIYNLSIEGAVGLGVNGTIDTLDLVDLDVGLRYDLVNIGYNKGRVYCNQKYFIGVEGTVFIVFDFEIYPESGVRGYTHNGMLTPWEEDTSNDIWTIFGVGAYYFAGGRFHIGLDVLSLVDELRRIL